MAGMFFAWSFTKCLFFFYVNRKSKMATTAGHSFSIAPYGKMKKLIFLRNYIFDWIQSVHEESFDSPLQKIVSIRNPRWPPPLGMGTYGENILKLFFFILNCKTIGWQTWLECSLDGSSHNAFLFPSEFQDDSADHDLKQMFNHSLPKETPVSCLEVILYWLIVFWWSSTCILNLLRTLNIV